MPRLGGHILVEQLKQQGVEQVFCVPGESYLAVLDGLHDADISLTVCRQEGGAAMMAEAYGKLTGQPGICMVTRGPGATNAYAGVHIAKQDSTPMILFVGQIRRDMRDREAFQEMDYKRVFGDQAKWVTEIDQIERIPEILSRAFHVATSGRPGPVVIALPEDMLTETAAVPDAPHYQPVETVPSAAQLQELSQQLRQAKQPIAILGGSRWSAQACAQFAQLAQQWQLPVAVQFRRQQLFPTDHPYFVGDLGLGTNPDLLKYIADSDCVLLLGGRMSEVPSQSYTLFDIPNPKAHLIHVHPDPLELNRVYRADLALCAAPHDFVKALHSSPQANDSMQRDNAAFTTLKNSYQQWTDTDRIQSPGELQMATVIKYLADTLPKDAILANGAGNYATWVHRFYPFRKYGTQLAPTSGSMGYGLPAAVAAKRTLPDKTVICFAGDGCFMMHGQEFATAVQYNLPIIVLIIDNAMYGTIRMHQEGDYPGRPSGTDLRNPDFAAYAQAFGGHGERVTKTADFAPAFARAQASGKPALIHCFIDPEAISPTRTLTEIQESAQAKK
ncbi:MAG TPA: thiamine pyrophosphate-binding protein [Paenalcaligenes sp.]|nr:thiamine pyrophosphate-binding protein [Paenalcaligenes sp.]